MAEPGGQEQVGVVTAEKLRPEAPRPLWEVYGEISEMGPGQLAEKVRALEPREVPTAVGLFQIQVETVEQLLTKTGALKTGGPREAYQIWREISDRRYHSRLDSALDESELWFFLERGSAIALSGEWSGPDKDIPTTVEEFITRELARAPEYHKGSSAERKRLDDLQRKFEAAGLEFGYHPPIEEIDKTRRYQMDRFDRDHRPLFNEGVLRRVKDALIELEWMQRYPDINKRYRWHQLEDVVEKGAANRKLINAAIEHPHWAVFAAVAARTDLDPEQRAKIDARRRFEAQTRQASPEPK